MVSPLKVGLFQPATITVFFPFIFFFLFSLELCLLCGVMGISQYYQPMYIHFHLAHILLPTLF